MEGDDGATARSKASLLVPMFIVLAFVVAAAAFTLGAPYERSITVDIDQAGVRRLPQGVTVSHGGTAVEHATGIAIAVRVEGGTARGVTARVELEGALPTKVLRGCASPELTRSGAIVRCRLGSLSPPGRELGLEDVLVVPGFDGGARASVTVSASGLPDASSSIVLEER